MRWAMVAVLVFSAGGLTAVAGGTGGLVRWARTLVVGQEAEAPVVTTVDRKRNARVVATKVAVNESVAPGIEGEAPEEVAVPLPEPVEAPVLVAPMPARRRQAIAGPVSTGAVGGVQAPPVPAVPVAGPIEVAPEVIDDLAQQSAAVRGAIELLRRKNDPAGALAALRAYQERFPAGALQSEASLLSIDALLAMERFDEAVRVAESSPAVPLVRRRELQLLGAEKLALKDCGAAVARFEFLLRGSVLPPAMKERALYGRAGCHLRLHDDVAAGRDLHAYLAEFPAGRFAADAKVALRALEK